MITDGNRKLASTKSRLTYRSVVNQHRCRTRFERKLSAPDRN